MRRRALLCLLIVLLALTGVASAATIYVPDDYATIQEAVGNAAAGDTIVVRDGVYRENIWVSKPLTLISENGSENCIVRAADRYDDVFHVAADHVKISGFTIEYGWWGIYLDCAGNCNITNNVVSYCDDGIKLWYSSGNVITDNDISDNRWGGICLWDSSSNVIVGNSVSDNWGYGIELMNSNNNAIVDNSISYHDYGIYLDFSDDNVITGNDVSKSRWNGIYLWDSNNNVIFLNNFMDNADNVHSSYSTNVWNSPSPVTYAYEGRTYTSYMGNYWSDYTGSDADGDGIGDMPYSIDGDWDYYPLVEPFENYALESRPPVASFTCAPKRPIVNQTVIFDASASYDPDGAIVFYEWDFGDGATASGVVVTHAYSAAGSYTVTLTVTDDAGAANSTSVLITVLPPPPPTPAASISTDKYEYAAGDTMLISVMLRNPTDEWQDVRFLWRFDVPDYGLGIPIVFKALRLPPSYERTFTLRWRLPAWRLSFNASWYVALFDTETSELISDDRADWRYVAGKGMGMVPTPAEEVREEIGRLRELAPL